MEFLSPDPFIGGDILDIGSRKAEMRARRQRGGAGLASGFGLPTDLSALGNPGQFDVPNVPDVSTSLV